MGIASRTHSSEVLPVCVSFLAHEGQVRSKGSLCFPSWTQQSANKLEILSSWGKKKRTSFLKIIIIIFNRMTQ